ncbi:MAG TPA: hypothetical protein VMX17_00270 [Candidatus Glassbacteria bacterium]|nr:hypothetical protein [Candidatus Glassbacteria bacterium]
MAYLTNTILDDLQVTGGLDEAREGNYGIMDFVKDSTPKVDYVDPDTISKLQTMSGARDANLPVIKDGSVTVGTTPGFDQIPVNLGETATIAYTAYDVCTGMRLYPSTFANNAVRIENYIAAQMKKLLKGCATTAEGIIETVMEAQKTTLLDSTTQVSQGSGTFTFDSGTDTLTANKAAQNDTMFAYLNQLMSANLLGGNYGIITNPAGLAFNTVDAMKYQMYQATYKEWDQSNMPLSNRYMADSIDPSSDVFHGWLARLGSIGVVNNFPFDFVNGTEIAGKKWSISNTELPYIKMRANVFMNTEATDASAMVTATDTNTIMTTFEEMFLWFRFYVLYPYNSDLSTRANPIVKIVGATT